MSTKNKHAAISDTDEVKTDLVETEDVKEKDAVPAKAEPKQDTKENLVYLGPTIVGVVKHAAVYKDGILPEKTEAYAAGFPAIRKLFVQQSKMVEAVKELNKPQSALRSIYEVTLKNIRGGK